MNQNLSSSFAQIWFKEAESLLGQRDLLTTQFLLQVYLCSTPAGEDSVVISVKV